jgi:hypothetical protein
VTELSAQLIDELNVALNEATLLGAELDVERRSAWITLSVLALPEEGPAPEDLRVSLVLHPVGRVAASLRHGRWDDRNAPVERFATRQLLDVVLRHGGEAIYGWKFVDVPPEDDFADWSDRLSLDWRADDRLGRSHTLILGQGGASTLDLCFWFDTMTVLTAAYGEIELAAFAAAGRRWWDALYAGDPRTAGAGIVPLRRDETRALDDTLRTRSEDDARHLADRVMRRLRLR